MDKYVYKNISKHICLIYHTATHIVAALVLNIPLQYSPRQHLQLGFSLTGCLKTMLKFILPVCLV